MFYCSGGGAVTAMYVALLTPVDHHVRFPGWDIQTLSRPRSEFVLGLVDGELPSYYIEHMLGVRVSVDDAGSALQVLPKLYVARLSAHGLARDFPAKVTPVWSGVTTTGFFFGSINFMRVSLEPGPGTRCA